MEGHHVVLAHGVELNVLDDNHVVVVLREQGLGDDLGAVLAEEGGGVGLYDFECGVWRPLSLEASSSYCTAALHSE
jgi:hypothetical protein